MDRKEIPLISSWEECWQVLHVDFAVILTDLQKVQLQSFHSILQEASAIMNLTKHDSLADFLTFHVLDTALLLPFLQEYRPSANIRYLDLGSGCGVPGFILHILLQKEQFNLQSTLCESRKKRAEYLREVTKKLDLLDSVDIVSETAEKMLTREMFKKQFDIVTARAFAKPKETLKIVAPFLNQNGLFLPQTSTSLEEELEYLFLSKKLKLDIKEEKYFQLAEKKRWVSVLEKNLL